MLQRYYPKTVIAPKTLCWIVLAVYIVSAAAIVAQAVWGDYSEYIDVDRVYQKEVSFWFVLAQNVRNMVVGVVAGLMSFGLLSLGLLVLNVVGIGRTANALVLDGHANLALKMAPHGVVEVLVMAIAAVVPFVVWAYILRSARKVAQREVALSGVLRDGGAFLAITAVTGAVLLVLAATIEALVSRVTF
jgi:hypothetical protein